MDSSKELTKRVFWISRSTAVLQSFSTQTVIILGHRGAAGETVMITGLVGLFLGPWLTSQQSSKNGYNKVLMRTGKLILHHFKHQGGKGTKGPLSADWPTW